MTAPFTRAELIEMDRRTIALAHRNSSDGYSKIGFNSIGVFINILAFFGNRARIDALTRRLFNQREESLLPVSHERVKIVRAQERGINQMR